MSRRGLGGRPTMPHSAIADQEWREDAACRSADPELFFSSSSRDIEAARAYCASCPVREPCLGDAMDREESNGVWGGMSEDERRAAAVRRTTAA